MRGAVTRIGAAVAATLLAACDSGPAAGTIEVTVAGTHTESGLEAGPWSIAFTELAIDVGDPNAQAGHELDEVTAPGFTRFDLVEAGSEDGRAFVTLDAPGGDYDHRGYTLRDLSVVGTATMGVATIAFDWEIPMLVLYGHCAGRVTIDGDVGEFEIRVLADALFFDDAVAADPATAFQAIADADGADLTTPDGVVTGAELWAVELDTLDGYEVGTLEIATLWDFIVHQASTMGRIDGDGLCGNVVVLD